MTALELFESNLAYYSVDPENRRCIRNGSCTYSGVTVGKPKSEGCGIGRHMKPEDALALDEYGKAKCGIDLSIRAAITKSETKSLFPNWMSEIDPDHLQAIQGYHDQTANWTPEGISETGKVGAILLKDLINGVITYNQYLGRL